MVAGLPLADIGDLHHSLRNSKHLVGPSLLFHESRHCGSFTRVMSLINRIPDPSY